MRAIFTESIFKKLFATKDMLKLDAETINFSANVLSWIADRNISIRDESLKSLWLLPLSNGLHRKVISQNTTLKVYLPPISMAGDVMRKVDAQLSTKPLPLLCLNKDMLGRRHSVILKQILEDKEELGVENAADLVVFLRWLCQTLPTVSKLADDQRHDISKAIASRLSESLAPAELNLAWELISELGIFQKVTWEMKGDSL